MGGVGFISNAPHAISSIIPITTDLDVESLLEDWCKRYCEFNGYELVEVQDNDGILHVKRTQHHPYIQTACPESCGSIQDSRTRSFI